MQRPMHRRCSRNGPWWVAGKGIQGKESSANQTQATDALEQRKPDRIAPWCQEPIPAHRREHQQDAVDDKIDLLHPTAWTQAEGANGLLEGIIARSCKPFNKID